MGFTSDPKNVRNEIKDQRKHQRQDLFYTAVEYILISDIANETFIGFTLNFSNSGLCIYTSELLNEGQKIIIKSCFPVHSKKAIVSWVEKCDDVFYKIGLFFDN